MTESETSPKRGSWVWISHDATNAPEMHPGDLVGFEAFGWTAFGVVTQCDEDGITIREEPPEPPYTDPCATCRIRDEWCCDPWETRDEHEGEAE